MRKVLYVEPDEEITDLVERMRQNGDAGELVFVLPNRLRTLASPLNLRLLQQYSHSLGKKTAIVSGDPRVQQLARDAGFPTFASVQAYERGVEVARPHDAESVEPVAAEAMPEIGAGIAAAAAAATAAARTRGTVGSAATVAPPSPPDLAARRARVAQPPPPGRRRMRGWYAAAAAVFVIGLMLLFLVAPSAKVTVTIGAVPIGVHPTIQGSTDTSSQGQPDHIVTTVETADESQQFTAKPTGTKDVPAAPATGQVVFTTDLPNGAQFTIPTNEEFKTTDNPPVSFRATQDTAVTVPAGGQPSNPVPVQDATGEARGNVAANTITVWPQNPCAQPTQPGQDKLCSPSDLNVSNPQATSGGADAKHLVVASQQDVTTFAAQADQIKRSLSDKVRQDMQSKASGLTAAVDPSGAGTVVSVDIEPPLPKPDDTYAVTTVTVSVHGKAAFYNPSDVRRAVEQDLSAMVPQGQMLARRPDVTNMRVFSASEDGTMSISVEGSAFRQPTLDIGSLKDQLTGKSTSSAERLIGNRLGDQVQNVQIDRSIPFFVLPFFSSRIEVVEQVVPEKTS